MSASIGLSAASEKGRELPALAKLPLCNSPGKRKCLLFTSRWRRSSRWRRHGIPRVEYVTIELAHHNRTRVSQSGRLLVKPQRPCTDLCAEPVGMWNRLPSPRKTMPTETWWRRQNRENLCTSLQQAEPWWRASIWRSHRKVVIKQCSYHNNIIDIQNRLPYSKVVYPAIIVLFSCLMEVNHGVRTGPDYPFR